MRAAAAALLAAAAAEEVCFDGGRAATSVKTTSVHGATSLTLALEVRCDRPCAAPPWGAYHKGGPWYAAGCSLLDGVLGPAQWRDAAWVERRSAAAPWPRERFLDVRCGVRFDGSASARGRRAESCRSRRAGATRRTTAGASAWRPC